jgi:hypothetical protein
MGEGGGRAAPLFACQSAQKTGARSARARTRGQNPLVPRYLGKISKFSVELYFWPQLLDSQLFFSFIYNKAI